MEDLASHGYIVFSISHPYDTGVVVFTNGDVVYFKGSLDSLTNQIYVESFQEHLGYLINNQSLSVKRQSLERIREIWRLNSNLDIWVNDTMYLIDQLAISNNERIPAIIRDKYDLERIGVVGHSFRGATAGEMCLVDDRVVAEVNLDGMHFGSTLELNLTKPFMLMYSSEGNQGMNDVLYLQSETTCYNITILGTKHFNFGDMSIWGPVLVQIGFIGSIDGYRMLDVTNTYVISFFNKYLKNIDSQLLESISSFYPEVIFQKNDK